MFLVARHPSRLILNGISDTYNTYKIPIGIERDISFFESFMTNLNDVIPSYTAMAFFDSY